MQSYQPPLALSRIGGGGGKGSQSKREPYQGGEMIARRGKRIRPQGKAWGLPKISDLSFRKQSKRKEKKEKWLTASKTHHQIFTHFEVSSEASIEVATINPASALDINFPLKYHLQ